MTEPGWIFARGFLAVGGGSSGIGGTYGVELDVWPLRLLGIGLEVVRGGTTAVSFDDPPAHDAFAAERLRLSGRFDLRGNALAVVTASAGPTRSRKWVVRCPADLPNCNDFPGEGVGPYAYEQLDRGWSGAIEGGVYHRSDALHMGLVIRADLTKNVSSLTFGPALGVEF